MGTEQVFHWYTSSMKYLHRDLLTKALSCEFLLFTIFTICFKIVHPKVGATLCSARGLGDTRSGGSPLPGDGTSLRLIDTFRLLLFLDSPRSPSLLMGLISGGNIESSLVLVSSRYRLRALPVMDACKKKSQKSQGITRQSWVKMEIETSTRTHKHLTSHEHRARLEAEAKAGQCGSRCLACQI